LSLGLGLASSSEGMAIMSLPLALPPLLLVGLLPPPLQLQLLLLLLLLERCARRVLF
jgi:hypothetical protein